MWTAILGIYVLFGMVSGSQASSISHECSKETETSLSTDSELSLDATATTTNLPKPSITLIEPDATILKTIPTCCLTCDVSCPDWNSRPRNTSPLSFSLTFEPTETYTSITNTPAPSSSGTSKTLISWTNQSLTCTSSQTHESTSTLLLTTIISITGAPTGERPPVGPSSPSNVTDTGNAMTVTTISTAFATSIISKTVISASYSASETIWPDWSGITNTSTGGTGFDELSSANEQPYTDSSSEAPATSDTFPSLTTISTVHVTSTQTSIVTTLTLSSDSTDSASTLTSTTVTSPVSGSVDFSSTQTNVPEISCSDERTDITVSTTSGLLTGSTTKLTSFSTTPTTLEPTFVTSNGTISTIPSVVLSETWESWLDPSTSADSQSSTTSMISFWTTLTLPFDQTTLTMAIPTDITSLPPLPPNTPSDNPSNELTTTSDISISSSSLPLPTLSTTTESSSDNLPSSFTMTASVVPATCTFTAVTTLYSSTVVTWFSLIGSLTANICTVLICDESGSSISGNTIATSTSLAASITTTYDDTTSTSSPDSTPTSASPDQTEVSITIVPTTADSPVFTPIPDFPTTTTASWADTSLSSLSNYIVPCTPSIINSVTIDNGCISPPTPVSAGIDFAVDNIITDPNIPVPTGTDTASGSDADETSSVNVSPSQAPEEFSVSSIPTLNNRDVVPSIRVTSTTSESPTFSDPALRQTSTLPLSSMNYTQRDCVGDISTTPTPLEAQSLTWKGTTTLRTSYTSLEGRMSSVRGSADSNKGTGDGFNRDGMSEIVEDHGFGKWMARFRRRVGL